MTQARIVYGQPLADAIYQGLVPWIEWLKQRMQRSLSLHVVLIGDDPASLVYVRRKQSQCLALGITSEIHHYPAASSMEDVKQLLAKLNANNHVDGILVQMPLPPHLNSTAVLSLIDPLKDVDGLTPTNLGALYMGLPGLWPCTPLGVMHILKHIWGDVKGKHVVVKGRSILVGRSLATMLTHAHATVTLMHSHSQNARELTRSADGIIMAVGKPGALSSEDIRPGTVVVDVGINRTLQGTLAGDVDINVASVAGVLTPVPGGVGPMTIAALMANTIRIAYNRFMALEGAPSNDELAVFKHTHPFPIGSNL